jgi:predicted DNA-binding helix-hairpin-helix protein
VALTVNFPILAASAMLPLEAPPLQREHRLYQADWLLRFHGFTPEKVAASGEKGMPHADTPG